MTARPLLFAWALAATACGDTSEPAATKPAKPNRSGPVDVRALSFPAAWLATRVGGSAVSVENVLPEGEDAPFWSPPGDTVAALQSAELIVMNGQGFEKWVETATLPSGSLVDSAASVTPIHLEAVTHSHGKGGAHSHAALDPHTWSDPIAFTAQAEAVHAALVKARPEQSSTFGAGLAAVKTDLADVDEALRSALAPASGLPLAASHPAFNYLARRYSLSIESFDFDPETPVLPADRKAFDAWMAATEAPHILLWEGAPTDAVKRSFPAGVIHAYIDPLEQPGPSGTYDYVAQARANVAAFDTLFKAVPTKKDAP